MNKIQKVIQEKEQECFRFHPERSFYDTVKINQKRWGLLINERVSPTLDELKSIAAFFDVEITEFF